MLGTFMVSAARTSWSVHQGNGRLQSSEYPAFPSPALPQRLLIVSPHPDDETLGCGGLIRRATAQGIPVTIVIVTNGDAFPWAVQRAYNKIRPSSSDYIRFGELRQKETLKALGELGVAKKNIIFLGYPDRGLEPLWMTHWDSSKPYKALKTRRTRNPYPGTYRPRAAYTGESLTEDLRNILQAVRPTDLFFTHPNDDHPDHAYLSGFILAALNRLDPKSWTPENGIAKADGRMEGFHHTLPGLRLHTFLVHRGNWPTPQGYHSGERLPPPAALARLDTRWRTLDLSAPEKTAKTKAIREYKSQLRVRPGARFLLSFVRENELFGEYRFLRSVPPAEIGQRYTTPWFLTLDPTDDKVPRDLEPGADLQEVALRRVGDDLVVRVMTRGDMSRWVRYRINLHTLGSTKAPAPHRYVVRYRSKRLAGDVPCAWERDALEVRIPLSRLGNTQKIMVNAETIVGGIVVDRSAWRGYATNESPVAGR